MQKTLYVLYTNDRNDENGTARTVHLVAQQPVKGGNGPMGVSMPVYSFDIDKTDANFDAYSWAVPVTLTIAPAPASS